MDLSTFESWAVIVAGIAAIVSAGFAVSAARQAKRQADAVLGDVPPVISLYQPPVAAWTSFAQVALEIINHNRRPIYIERWKFDFPADYRIFQDHQDERASLGAIFDAVMHGKRDFTFDIPQRLPGSSGSSDVPTERAVFKISDAKSETPPVGFGVKAMVWYRVDGEKKLMKVTRRIDWKKVERKD